MSKLEKFLADGEALEKAATPGPWERDYLPSGPCGSKIYAQAIQTPIEQTLVVRQPPTNRANQEQVFANGKFIADVRTRVGKQREIIRVLVEAVRRVHDDEETGGWGPDTTMKSVLANALAEAERIAGGRPSAETQAERDFFKALAGEE